MNELRREDLSWVVSRIPRDLQKFMRERANKLFLAGGTIRSVIAGEQITDYDLFGPSKEFLETCADQLLEKRGARTTKWETQNAITLLQPPRIPVQFITRWCYDSAQAIVESFDFTICQAVVWYNRVKWCSIISDRFYSDLAAKRLYYTAPRREEDAGGSIMRARKFLSRGYNIQPYSLARVITRLIRGIDFSQRREWDETWLSSVLTELLREVDPLGVTDGVDLVEEHVEPEGMPNV